MHLISLSLNDVRIHSRLEISFDPIQPTLIGGPNESGKSTVVDALRSGLLLPARGNSQPVRDLRPRGGGNPVIRLVFHAQGRDWTVLKRYTGANGSTELQATGMPALRGEDADRKLAELLRTDATEMRPSELWRHVFVHQGESGRDPAVVLQPYHARLIGVLTRREGAAELQQSDTDREVAVKVAQECGRIFIRNGAAFAKTSDASRAEEVLEAARARLAQARAREDELQRTLDHHIQAEQRIDEFSKREKALDAELADANARSAQVKALRLEQAERSRIHDEAQRAVKECEQAEHRVREAREEHTRASEEVTRIRESHSRQLTGLGGLRERVGAARMEVDRCSAAAASTHEQAEHLQRLSDLAQATADHRAAVEAAERIARAQAAVEELARQMGALPEVTDATLRKLQGHEDTITTCEAKLAAMAATFVVEQGAERVRVDGSPAVTGRSTGIRREHLLEIGEEVRLRIRPGTIESVEELETQKREAEEARRRIFGDLGVAGIVDARSLLDRRKELQAALKRANQDANARREEEGARAAAVESTRDREAALRALIASIEDTARREGRMLPSAVDAAQARELLDAAKRADEAARSALRLAQRAFDATREQLSELESKAQDLAVTLARAETAAQAAATNAARLEAQHGTDEQRQQAAAQAATRSDQTGRQLQETVNALAGLNADALERDLVRLNRALDGCRNSLREAREARIAAATRLSLDGSSDPAGEAREAADAFAAAERSAKAARNRASALRMLNEAFEQERTRMAEATLAPFLEKVRGYLEDIFGNGTSLVLAATDAGFEAAELRRGGEWSAFSFEQLSGGTREQVATAVRLAALELLASEHDGRLPVILDDAFVNTDPQRLRSLQRMLDRAAERGLQVVVLSCTPEDYSSLGAKEFHLEPGRPAAPAPTRDVGAPTGDEDEESADGAVREPSTRFAGTPAPVDSDSERKFLQLLEQAGGSSGNVRLRGALGWDEATYQAVRDRLKAAGLVTRGQGRGGSVRLSRP